MSDFEIPDELDFEQEPAPVIPDSIEPYRGYKALNIVDDGYLHSPSYAARWPAGKPYEAVCAASGEWGWVPVQGEPRSEDDTVTISHHQGQIWSTSTVTVASSAGGGSVRAARQRPRPSNPLPPGWSWSWEMFTHTVPDEACHCGIYVATTPGACIQYMGQSNGIIVEVALWGRVIPAHSGARGQYAYPQRILAPRSLVQSVRPTAQLYNIPVLVLDPTAESELVCMDPVCACVGICRVTGTPLPIDPGSLPFPPPTSPAIQPWKMMSLTRHLGKKK